MRASLIVLLLAVGGIARAAEGPPASCFADTNRWSYDREKETLAAPGERFLEDLRKCDSTFAASVIEAIRYQIHDDETKKFVRAKGFVLTAWGLAWALLVLAGLALWLRQRRLDGEIAVLEAKVRSAEKAT